MSHFSFPPKDKLVMLKVDPHHCKKGEIHSPNGCLVSRLVGLSWNYSPLELEKDIFDSKVGFFGFVRYTSALSDLLKTCSICMICFKVMVLSCVRYKNYTHIQTFSLLC